jgi:hypothetical protein
MFKITSITVNDGVENRLSPAEIKEYLVALGKGARNFNTVA